MRTVFLLACASLGAGAACTASAEEVRMPETELHFPTGAEIAPNEAVLFVANANSDLEFDSGSINVFDLDKIDQVIAAWETGAPIPDGPECEQDRDHTETLICTEERFIIAQAGARIGNFVTDVAVQDRGGGALRLIVPVRGDPSVTYMDWDGSKLSCTANPDSTYALCDEDHRLSYIHDNADLPQLPDEPFDAFAASDYAVVTHLTTGAVTLIDSQPTKEAVIADVATGLFAPDPSSGLRGATGIAVRPPGDMIYVGSRSEDRIQTLTVGRPVNSDIAPPYLIYGNYFFLDFVGGNTGGSNDTRGLAFSPTGDRLYAINRRPPSLQIIDTSLSETGFPRNKGMGATDICRQASTLNIVDAGDGERAYVACFQDGEVYIIDPRGEPTVVDVISVGRGPYAVAAAPGRKKLYVTNFLENTIAVIDISPTSMHRNRVVLQIGEELLP